MRTEIKKYFLPQNGIELWITQEAGRLDEDSLACRGMIIKQDGWNMLTCTIMTISMEILLAQV